MSANTLVFLRNLIAMAYADLWAYHRGLIVALGRENLVIAERLEAEARAWVSEHLEDVYREGLDRFDDLVRRAGPDQPASGA